MEFSLSDISNIIIALIGLLSTICGVLLPKLLDVFGVAFSKSKTKNNKQINLINLTKNTFILLGLILIFFVIGSFLFNYYNNPYIKITSHRNGAFVKINEQISGNSRNILSNKVIWIFVYSYVDNVFYPHKKNAEIENSGKWVNRNTIIGSSLDQEKQFDIVPLLIDRDSQSEIINYLNSPDSHGLNELPTKAIRFESIKVIRK